MKWNRDRSFGVSTRMALDACISGSYGGTSGGVLFIPGVCCCFPKPSCVVGSSDVAKLSLRLLVVTPASVGGSAPVDESSSMQAFFVNFSAWLLFCRFWVADGFAASPVSVLLRRCIFFTLLPHRSVSSRPLLKGSVSSQASNASSASSRFMKQTNPVFRRLFFSSVVLGHMIFTEYNSPNCEKRLLRSSSAIDGARFPTNILVVKCSSPGFTKLPFLSGTKRLVFFGIWSFSASNS
mmetsp:Transcript_2951/g.6342  ORF Transcript_2951/g.6342 Transcript_2951/m.6342 type:complete len:237 (-) Transcript_2951:554-1264(-)